MYVSERTDRQEVALITSAWIEISKATIHPRHDQSHSLRVRGLKYHGQHNRISH